MEKRGRRAVRAIVVGWDVDVNNKCLGVCCETEPDEPELGTPFLTFHSYLERSTGAYTEKNGVNPQGRSVEMGGTADPGWTTCVVHIVNTTESMVSRRFSAQSFMRRGGTSTKERG